jgi:hypothetical protein
MIFRATFLFSSVISHVALAPKSENVNAFSLIIQRPTRHNVCAMGKLSASQTTVVPVFRRGCD